MDRAALQKKEAFLSETLKTLEGEVRRLSRNQSAGFIAEFLELEHLPSARTTCSMKADNRRLNRYNNILAYDHSRVKVTTTKANGNNDYINGNFIKGFSGKPLYIATQAPVPESFSTFWQMIWDNKINVVVMVTNEVEGGKLKCHRYWPDQFEPQIHCGDFKIQTSFQEVFPTFVRRTFSMSNTKGEFRDLTQFAFTAWPDHGVPSTTQELLDFRSEVRKLWTPEKGRVAVHCSAGVGRTGTFIATDRFLDGIAKGKYVPLLDIVTDLRTDRNFMVQSQIQYIYLFHICLDGIHEMLLETQRLLRRATMSDVEKQEEEFDEIQSQVNNAEDMLDEEIEDGESQLDEAYRRQPQQFPAPLAPRTGTLKRAKPAPPPAEDAVSEYGFGDLAKGPDASYEVGRYTDDLSRASRVPTALRRSSLLETGGPDSDLWRARRRVPLTPREKGYFVDQARGLGQRINALDQQYDAWKKRYEQAFTQWQRIMDDGGEVYNISRQMTPLESRLESLAAAEEAWKLRGDAVRSAREEDLRRTLARLTQRLQSLQEAILLNEARWRAKTDMAKQKQVVEAGMRVHTTDKLGGLMERLELLQQEEQAWVKRDNFQRFDRSKFDYDVKCERALQEKIQRERDAAEQLNHQQAQRRASEMQFKEEEVSRAKAHEQSEVDRRDKVKERMKQASVLETTYDPDRERQAKQKQRELEEQAVKDAKVAADKLKKEEEEKAQAKKKEIDDAKQKASRFLGKLKL